MYLVQMQTEYNTLALFLQKYCHESGKIPEFILLDWLTD